jgi:hypothetical protein
MRVAMLLLCFGLAACAGSKLPGEQPAPNAASAVAPETVAAPVQNVRARSGPSSGAGGGASTAGVRAAPEAAAPDRLTQARVDCWMKVEHEKGVRDLDRRIAFVDKCVAERIKDKP